MSDGAGEKPNKNGSFPESDSFDEPKGAPISMEPVFSTAAGVRIDVKQESIDKSKKLLNNDLKKSSHKNSFSSPLIRPKSNGSSAFISPFRRDEPSSSTRIIKRSCDNEAGDSEAPPPKKRTVSPTTPPELEKKKSNSSYKKEKKEIHADVLRISRIYEKEQFRMILQESNSSPLILATCSYRRGNDIKFGDRIHVDSEVFKKSDSNDITEIYIKKVLKNKINGARNGIRRHSIAKMPFCIIPRVIHELSDQSIKKTVLQVNILDMNVEIYEGCTSCKHLVSKSSRSSSRRNECKNCKDSKGKLQSLIYSRMRVMDFSGQMFVNVTTKTMEKVLELFGYEGIDNWFQFREPQERKNYVFYPIMIEIEKSRDEWECTDVAQVDWGYYGAYLKEKSSKIELHSDERTSNDR